jgi:two-component system LytT family response regulator
MKHVGLVRAVIVDDEALGREAVREQLRTCPDFEIVAECGGGEDAVTRIRELAPDVVFLDIQMPGVDGFDVLAELGDQAPLAVMVTAYDQYALRAFEHYAVDYVLKPIDPARFASTINRVRQRLADARPDRGAAGLREMTDSLAGRGALSERLIFKATGGFLFLEPDELTCVESAGNYLKLRVGDREYLLRETMGRICTRLDSARFMRIHRSFLVNINHVREIRLARSSTEYKVILRDGTTLPVGRSYRDPTLDRFEGQR